MPPSNLISPPRRRLGVAARLALGIAVTATTLAPNASGAQDAQISRGHQDASAEAFVRDEAGRVLQILGDRTLSVDVKKQTFRKMIDQVADVPRITTFVLGKYRRSLTNDQYSDFSSAFRDYADNIYESRLGEYRGQTLKITGSIQRRPGDSVVASEVIGADGAGTAVNWRCLRGQDGRYRVVDVEISGIWLAITEQQDFVSTLDNHNGDVSFLIGQLRRGEVAKAR